MAIDSYPLMINFIESKLGAAVVTTVPKDGLIDFIRSVIKTQEHEEPFNVMDLGVVAALMSKWTQDLPTIRPFYAVKCNPDRVLLCALAALGAGFDCSSRTEIDLILSLGISPDRIIYANPCKAESHIRYSASVGVNLTTFDSIAELEKMRKCHSKSELLLRVKVLENAGAMFPLDSKYGALPEEIVPLLQSAKHAGLNVVGVAFHIGSGATHFSAFKGAVASAKMIFDVASNLGMPRMNVLNIGGGFTSGPLFDDAANNLKSAIEMYFGNEVGLKVMAEPGRFLVESAVMLATSIIGKRVRGELREYWINDGVYGCLNIVQTGVRVTPLPLMYTSNPTNPLCQGETTHCSTVFGPTCCALDKVLEDQRLPELNVTDWLLFPDMGAYTTSVSSNFNGFNAPAMLTHLIYSSSV